jgi:MFS family permease
MAHPAAGPARAARAATAYTFAANGAMWGSWAPRIPEVKAHLGLTSGALGVALSGLAIGAVIALPLGGAVAARIGTAQATRVAYITFCLVVILPAIAVNWATLFAALVIWGIAIGGLDVAMNAQGVSVERAYGRSLLSGFHAAFSLGALLGSAVGSAGAALGIPLPLQLGGFGLVTMMFWMPLHVNFLPDPVAESPGPGPGSAGATAGGNHQAPPRPPLIARPTGALIWLGLAAFSVLIAEGTVADWSAVYLREVLAAGPGIAGFGFLAFSATMAVGRLVGDRLLTRFGRRPVIAILSTVAAAGFAGGLATGTLAGTVAGFAVLGFGLSVGFPAMVSEAGSGTDHPGLAVAAISTCGYLGFVVGPPVIGGLAQWQGLDRALWVVPVLAAIAALAIMVGGLRTRVAQTA